MEETTVENKPLSASKIKVLEDCSWLYWCSYHLKLPDKPNEGASRGTICHLVFEMLLKPRHYKYFERIIKAKTIDDGGPVSRLVSKHMRKENIATVENYIMIDQMILVGLKSDFFVKGKRGEKSELLGAELEFNINNQDPNYCIKGFMDKPFRVGSRVIIDDFKSSKAKYEGEEHISNIQGMMYSLAAKKLWPECDPEIRFIFLRFSDDPMVKVKFNEDSLKGFEHYLSALQQTVNNFTEEDAKKNFAFDKPNEQGFKGKVMCGFARSPTEKKKDGTPKWACKYKFPFKYYVLKDEAGKTLKSSFENNFTLKEGEKVLELQYMGCPKHRPPINEF